MAFKPAAGYGDMFSYTVANMRADGFEVQHLAGTILREAISQLVWARVMNESRDAFGKGKGGTFTVPIFKDWGAVATVQPLTSGSAIGIGSQKTDSIAMMINEYGTGIGYETLGDWITSLEVRGQLVNTLGRHLGRMINWLDYDVFANTPFTIEAVGTGSYNGLLGTNRHLVATAYGELGPGGVALAYDSLKKSLVEPFTSRGLYWWIASSETLRNLKSGSIFQNQMLYSQKQGDLYQILGEFNGFVFIETEEGITKGSSFCGGANAAGFGFGMMPRTFYYPDFGSDAGRLQVWKTLFYRGQGPIWRSKGTAAIMVRTKTAAFDYGALG